MASPLQFSVRQLLIVVAFLAVGLTALRNANSYWMTGLWGGVLLLLGVTILLVIFRRGPVQAFWIGCAVFGCLYAGVVLIAYWPRATPPGYFPLAAHQLATNQLSVWAYGKMIPAAAREMQIPNPAVTQGSGGRGFSGGMSGMGGPGMPMSGSMPGGLGPGMGGMAMSGFGGFGVSLMPNPDYVDINAFVQIAHSLWVVALAALGGKLAQWIYRAGVRDRETGVRGT